jgi:hypothetical protein
MIVPQFLVHQRAGRVTATSSGEPVDIEWSRDGRRVVNLQ